MTAATLRTRIADVQKAADEYDGDKYPFLSGAYEVLLRCAIEELEKAEARVSAAVAAKEAA